jgi:divalent metal cation (Fe/Co/Zn/Cd) transporter
MNLETGLIIVIGAVLIFYLRLIIIQRQRAQRARLQALAANKKKSKKDKAAPPPTVSFAILSHNPRDWVIAGAGALLIILGILFNARIIPLTWAQPYWWLPVSVGIIAFSWGFK